jgi:hypothetical protein
LASGEAKHPERARQVASVMQVEPNDTVADEFIVQEDVKRIEKPQSP